MPALAAALRRVLGAPEASDAESARFLSDVVDSCLKARNEVFPAGLAKPACEMRVQRLLARPVEVDGVVLSLRSLERRRLHQKSKQIVTRRGVLEGLDRAAPSPGSTGSTGHAPERVTHAPPGAFFGVPSSGADLRRVLERLESLEAALADVRTQFAALEMTYGAAPSADWEGRVVAPVNRRVYVAEVNHDRLASFVLGASPRYEKFVPETSVPISKGGES